MDGLDWDTIITVGLFVAGYVVAKWDRDRSAQTQSAVVDSELREKVRSLEAWQRDHHTIHACVTKLATKLANWGEKVEKLTDRFEDFERWMRQNQRRSPYDFPAARDWIREDQDHR